MIDHYCQHAKHKLGLIDAARREGLNSSVFRHVRALPTRGGFWGACTGCSLSVVCSAASWGSRSRGLS